MTIRVGRWDCPHCGHKGILGPEKHCGACGKPRGDNVRFYLPADADAVTDDAEIARAKAGPDWVCDHCGASNAHGVRHCQACGNQFTLDDTYIGTRVYGLNETPSNPGNESAAIATATPNPEKRGKMPIGWKALIVLVAAIYLLANRAAVLSVKGHEWRRTISIENYRLVQHEDWSIPSGGKLIRRYQAIHHYNEVFDHYETGTRIVRVKVNEERYISGHRDLGNGYFEDIYSTRPIYEDREEKYQKAVYRREPVYRTIYVYQIREWVTDHIAAAQGHDKNPTWPQGAPQSKIWRDGNRTEKFLLLLKDGFGIERTAETEYDHWRRLNIGDHVQAGDVQLITDQN